MAILTFIIVVLILFLEGFLLSKALLNKKTRMLHAAFALPLASFANVLLIFLFTIFSIPLTVLSLAAGHIVIILLAICKERMRRPTHPNETESQKHCVPKRKTLTLLCSVLLIANIIYAFSHSMLLPSFQYDSATNWTMRSRISYEDKAMAFDETEKRGMAKRQYPFLFHALQITANQGQSEWSDRAANTILYLLSLSIFLALFLIIRNIKGTAMAVLSLTLLTSIPLLSLHLAQGYGDIVLIEYLILSFSCLGMYIHGQHTEWLTLSAVFVAASVWTKSEGLFFGLAPWIVMISLICFFGKQKWRYAGTRIGIALLLSLTWPLFVLRKGLSLTPHSSSDFQFGLRSEGIAELTPALFARGSFGILWYALSLAIIMLLWMAYKSHQNIEKRYLPLLLWGGIIFVQTLFIYTFTPNVTFLLNSQSFYRQMLSAGALLILACVLLYKDQPKKEQIEIGEVH